MTKKYFTGETFRHLIGAGSIPHGHFLPALC